MNAAAQLTCLDVNEFHNLNKADFDARVSEVRKLLNSVKNPREGMEILAATISHPIWQIRIVGVDAAFAWSHFLPAREALFNATHDAVDSVAFHAIRYCGSIREAGAIPHLVKISGWPSLFTQADYKRKPVGIGASLTKQALTTIFESEDPGELRIKENDFLAPYRKILRRQNERAPDLSDMMHVPAGPAIIGVNSVDDFPFFYRDFLPEKEVTVEEFYIDRLPVSNAQYSKFLNYARAEPHLVGHPDAPVGKDYTPAHWRDERFSDPDFPVTGVDWYDAWAYAKWAGKKLPSEIQWEKAARGPNGLTYPWGNEWDSQKANFVETSFGRKVEGTADWENLLRTYDAETPRAPVTPVDSFASGASPYGVIGLAGNVWEWTRTNFYDHKDMDPFFRGRHPQEFMNRPAAFAVIKGGCFTSLHQMLRGYYRGKDLLTDRHCEIGIRCVWEPVQNEHA